MTLVKAELDQCEEYANCATAADDYFDVDANGAVMIRTTSGAGGRLRSAGRGVTPTLVIGILPTWLHNEREALFLHDPGPRLRVKELRCLASADDD